jgi:hypothetical protein
MKVIKCPHCGSTAQVTFGEPFISNVDEGTIQYIALPCSCGCGCSFIARYDLEDYTTSWVIHFDTKKSKRAIITKAENNRLEFSDGTVITADHCPDCCEYNYAKFDDLDDIALNTVFDMNRMEIEVVEGSGIRIGNKPSKMFFVPCYSDQNGYYSSDLNIYINGIDWAHIENCEM